MGCSHAHVPVGTPGDALIYKDVGNMPLKLYVHYPPGWQRSDRRAAVLMFFSGAWKFGTPLQMYGHAKQLASLGVVAMRVDYRILRNPVGTTPMEGVMDAKSAIRWVRQHAAQLGVDPNRIVMLGASAGGQLSACAELCESVNEDSDNLNISSHPNALVLLNPVLDFNDTVWDQEYFGGDKVIVHALSPNQLIDHKLPPSLLVYGSKDHLTEQGRNWYMKALQQRSRSEMVVFEGKGHGFFKQPYFDVETLALVESFLGSLGYLDEAANRQFAPALDCRAQYCQSSWPSVTRH